MAVDSGLQVKYMCGMCFLDAIRNISTFIVFWNGINLSMLLSKSAKNSTQSAFFGFNRLLNVVGCATITGFTLTQLCV